MTISGTIKDVDKASSKIIVAITDNAIWRCADITAASPTWKRVYNGSNFPSDLGTDLKFRRVRCSGGQCYALAYVKSPDVAGAAHGYLFVSNGGLTWNYRRISTIEIEDAYDQFTIDTYIRSYEVTVSTQFQFLTTRRVSSEDRNPWGIGLQRIGGGTIQVSYSDGGGGSYDTFYYESGTSGVFNTGFGGYDVPHIHRNTLLSSAEATAFNDWFDAKYGAQPYGWKLYGKKLPKEDARANIGHKVTRLASLGPPGGPFTGIIAQYIIWKEDDPIMPLAMDVGKNNNQVVYVGLDDRILVTRDAGQTWDTYISDVGAYDIECHKVQDAGDYDITFWADTGALYRATNGSKGSAMWTESNASKVPFRIASDPNDGWPIYALSGLSANTYTLKRTENGGSWRDLVSDIYVGRSLRYHVGSSLAARRLYYMDTSGIHYSTDGETWANKIGGWSSYNDQVVCFPLSG